MAVNPSMYGKVRKALEAGDKTAAQLEQETGISRADLQAVVGSLMKKREVGFDSEAKVFYAAEAEEGQTEVAQAAPAPAPAPAPVAAPVAPVAAAPAAPRRAAPAPAPVAAQAQAPARKAQTAKAATGQAQFSMQYAAINTLSVDELQERIDTGIGAAAANYHAGQPLVAELIMRSVGKARSMQRKLLKDQSGE